MSRRWQLVLAVVGTLLLVVMVRVIGLHALMIGVNRVGWILLPILAVQFVAYALNAWAWWITIPGGPDRPSYAMILRTSLIGFAMNFVTPMVNAGGEPYRVAALAPRFGVAGATGSVLLYAMVHAVSSLLLWLAALIMAAFIFAGRGIGLASFLLGAVLVLIALVVVLRGHQGGFVVTVARWLSRLRLRRLSDWLERREQGLARVDEQIVAIWQQRRATLMAAFGIDLLSRLVAALEFVLVARALGLELGIITAITMWGLLALGMNLFFFFPWELGSREGSLYAITQLAELPDSYAGLAIIASRLRELVWAAIGMALLWTVNEKR